MPPEPFPSDRRDFRRHDRSGSGPRLGGGGPHRWREQQHHPYAPPPHPPPYHQQQQQRRWYSDFPSSRLLPPGHGKQQGDWRIYPTDGGQQLMPFGTRYGDRRNLEDENCRPFESRGNGRRHFRNNRENRGSFTQKDWKAPSWELARSPSAPWKTTIEVDNLRSIENTQTCLNSSTSQSSYASHHPPDPVIQSDQSQFLVKEKNDKKRRLGWGQGLAKYEKKKVEGPKDGAAKIELAVSVSKETLLSHVENLPEKSPRVVASLADCASPATPSSLASSSSRGSEEKESVTEANADHDTTNLSCSPSIGSEAHYDGPTFNLENLELASIANLSSSINELLQLGGLSSAETSVVRTTSMNKLLVWKGNIFKALEVTESEIDSLEMELKSLIPETRIYYHRPADSSSLPMDCQLKPCNQLVIGSNFAIRPAPLRIVSSGEFQNTSVALENEYVISKEEDIDSPGSATSRHVEVLPGNFPSETAEYMEGSMHLDVSNFMNDLRYEEKNSGCVDNHAVIGTSSSEDLDSGSDVHYDVNNIYDSIISSNKDSANRACEGLNKLLPGKQCLFDTSVASGDSFLQSDSSLVKEKFVIRKQFLQFKEKFLTLKFKVFQHFWKEGRLVSIRKHRVKTRKKFDPSRNGHKKNRSSSRSRISSYAGGRQTVPADEVIEFVNELLLTSAVKPCRNTLKMPALILDKEMKISRFISNNGLVEDPCAVEKERSMINPWTSKEKEIFIDKLAALGKDFKKIASFLDHKTIADCIEFYYKNHKSECFDKVKKNPDFIKQKKPQSTTYLVASGKRWNREANAASLDILGAASEIAANVDCGIEVQQKCKSRSSFVESSCFRPPRADGGALHRSNSIDIYSNERETVAADVLAGICGSLSPEAMTSCITSSVDPGDGYQDWRCPRVDFSIKRPLTPEVTQNVDDVCSDESCGELNPTDWTDEEKSIFIQAVSSYGNDFIMISQGVRTRSMDECKVFFSKARKCLELDLIQRGSGNVSGDFNDGSDIEDDCDVQTGSITCNNGSECKMEEDLASPGMKLNDEFHLVGSHNLMPDFKISSGDIELGTLDPMAAGSVLKNSLTGGSQVDDKPDADLNVDSKKQNGADVSSVAEKRALLDGSDGHCGEENKRQCLLLPDENLNNKTVEDRGANSNEVSDIGSEISEMKSEPQLAGNVSHLSNAHPSLQVDNISGYGKKTDLETCPAEKYCFSSLQQNGHLSSSLFSVPIIKYQKSPNHPASLAVGAYGISDDMHSQKFFRSDCQQHLLGYSRSDSAESSQILRGYPVSLQTAHGINGFVDCEKLVALQNVPKQDGNLHSHRHTGNGDVKLFGKILISSQQKSNSSLEPANDDNNSQDHKLITGRSPNLKLSADQKVSFDSAQSKFDRVSSENIPARSFGFWDGNSMQTGSPPLPDSARLLAKYPDAFSNSPMFSLKPDQPPLHEAVKISIDCPLNGVSAFQRGELSKGGNIVAENRVSRNQELQL